MKIYSKLKQYYRYLRNWKKFKSRQAKGGVYKNASEQLDFYSQFIKKDDLVFDIGANVGDKTDIFLKLGARVVAAEPQESCWRIIERRFENEDISIESVAVSNQEGEMELFVDRSTTLSTLSKDWITTVKQSGRFSNHKWAYTIPVKTTTLDTLIKKYGKPEFCKIDVEGFEFNVLRGLSQPVKMISFEFVSERIDITLNCIDYLSKLGEMRFNYYLGEAKSFSSPNWVTADEVKKSLVGMNKNIENYGDIYAKMIYFEKTLLSSGGNKYLEDH